MKIAIRTAICLSVLLLWSCEPSNKDRYKAVMKIHDEVMPKMDDIYKKQQDLKAQLEATSDSSKKEELERKISTLESAGEGMMVWMRSFNPPADSEGEEKVKEYLEGEMVKVTKVKEDILKALE